MKNFKPVNKLLQVWHYPNVPCKPFIVDVKDEFEALKIINTLADQHLWLFENVFIPDYNNVIVVMMWVDDLNEETGEAYGWNIYSNEEYAIWNWDEVESLIKTNTHD